MKKNIILSIIAVCTALCLTTCQTLSKAISEPKVSLHSVNLAGINFNGAQFLAKVKIDNPNSITIPFPEIGWKLSLNNSGLLDGVIKNNKSLKARGSTIVDVPVSFEFLQALNAITSLKGRSSANYGIDLAVKFNIPVIGAKVFNLNYNGNVPLPQVPKLTAPAMKLEKMDTTGASISFSINVENPNSFELPAPKANVDFQVNKTSVFKSAAPTDKLKPNSATPVTLRFSVNRADLLRAGANILTSGTVSTNFATSFDFGVPAFGNTPTTMQVPWSMPLR